MALTNQDINRCFMRFKDRAEKVDADKITSTFVDIGPLMDVLSSENNHIVNGRRGVGKTHAIRYLGNLRVEAGDVAFYIDLSGLGSDGSIYGNTSLGIPERATRLLVDVVTAIVNAALDYTLQPSSGIDPDAMSAAFDELAEAITQVRVTGDVSVVDSQSDEESRKGTTGFSAKAAASPEGALSLGTESGSSHKSAETVTRTGKETLRIEFGSLRRAVDRLLDLIRVNKVWLLFDEWSSIPIDLQPYLADLLRRSFFHHNRIVSKIAAIEHRSKFYLPGEGGLYIGFEMGADVSSSINLDDYLVFDNDPDRATEFFRILVSKHLATIAEELGLEAGKIDDCMRAAFTQDNAFREFVRATEGVPRDAMHLLALAAQKAASSAISIDIIRRAALTFYQTDKINSVQENPTAREMLHYIINYVISGKQTRAFLLPVSVNDKIIDYLFDRRLLHIIDRSKSAAHRPGERFRVYKIDYGCYVDLHNTDKFPNDLLFAGDEESIELRDVPEDDARSFRRAILDLREFYAQAQRLGIG